MPNSRKMTKRERRVLIWFVLCREWVLIAIGVLTMGISLSSLFSNHPAERISGLVLALLLLLAMGLFVWIKLQKDLRAGLVCEEDVDVRAKRQERGEATTTYWLVDSEGGEYEVPHRWYTWVEPRQAYTLTYTAELRIVLSAKRAL